MRERTPRPEGRDGDGTVLDFGAHFAAKQQIAADKRSDERLGELLTAMKVFDARAKALIDAMNEGKERDIVDALRIRYEEAARRIEALDMTEAEKVQYEWDARRSLMDARLSEHPEYGAQAQKHAS